MLFTLQRFAPRAPGPLITVVLAAAVVGVFSLQDYGIPVIGPVPAGLPSPAVPSLDIADLAVLIVPSIGIAFVGYTDNVLTGRAFALKVGQRTDANQEWTALAAANISSSLLHGFPVSSSGSRTALGAALGSRTQLYSLVALSVVLLTLVVGGPLLATFPKAALGALVIFAAVRLIDVGELRRIGRFRRSELLLAVVTTVAVLGVGILLGVVVAVAVSVVDLLRRLAHPHDGILGYVPGIAGMHDVDDYPLGRQVPGLVVYRYDAPLCFANAEDFRQRALKAIDAAGQTAQRSAEGGDPHPIEWFVLNAEAIVEIDVTSADALDQLRTELHQRGLIFAMARVKQDLRDDLVRADLVDRVGAEFIFPTLPTAVASYLHWHLERHGALPYGMREITPPPNPMEPPDEPAAQ
jgi:MFS superfamily sulfate permease-like transporter